MGAGISKGFDTKKYSISFSTMDHPATDFVKAIPSKFLLLKSNALIFKIKLERDVTPLDFII